MPKPITPATAIRALRRRGYRVEATIAIDDPLMFPARDIVTDRVAPGACVSVILDGCAWRTWDLARGTPRSWPPVEIAESDDRVIIAWPELPWPA